MPLTHLMTMFNSLHQCVHVNARVQYSRTRRKLRFKTCLQALLWTPRPQLSAAALHSLRPLSLYISSIMFEARLVQGKVLKQIIEAIKDLVADANIDCSEDELAIQSMDSSHVALVAVALQSNGFDHFRCDRSISVLDLTVPTWPRSSSVLETMISSRSRQKTMAMPSRSCLKVPAQDRIADFGTLMSDKSCKSYFTMLHTHSLSHTPSFRTQIDGH